MRTLMLSEIAAALGCPCAREAAVTRIVTDSRQCAPGTVFVAIRGENADGHGYAASALEKGAEAVVSERALPGVDPARVLRVADTKRALIRIGGLVRDGSLSSG